MEIELVAAGESNFPR